MKNITNIIVFVFLLGITVFSVIKYASTLKEKYDLQGTVEEMKTEVSTLVNVKKNLLSSLDKERENNNSLLQTNTGLKEELAANEEKLNKLDSQLKETLTTIEALNAQIATVQTENVMLKDQKEKLGLELAQSSGEKEALKAKMGSISELKKMIKELKISMRKTARVIQERVMTKKEKESVLGNYGYLLKNGKPTLLPKVRIEVQPIS